jgi:hypothetical protein
MRWYRSLALLRCEDARQGVRVPRLFLELNLIILSHSDRGFQPGGLRCWPESSKRFNALFG